MGRKQSCGAAWYHKGCFYAGIAWRPEADISENAVVLATGCTDSRASLWSASGQLLQRLTGHTNRLGKVAFHPCGSYLGTASFDGTWRLWDVESGETILEQEGHSRAVYALAFHPDGSLALSGGLDAYGAPLLALFHLPTGWLFSGSSVLQNALGR